jgi:hypothetical protein
MSAVRAKIDELVAEAAAWGGVTDQGCIRQMQPKANKDKRKARFDPDR